MKKQILLFPILSLIVAVSTALAQHSVSIIDFVQIKAGKHPEALYFYENNWKVYREIALKRDFIKSYRLLKVQADSIAKFDLMLITEYADTAQLNLSEARFQQIIKELNPNGPKLLNSLKPSDFRVILFSNEATTLFGSDKKKKKRR